MEVYLISTVSQSLSHTQYWLNFDEELKLAFSSGKTLDIFLFKKNNDSLY